MKVALMPRPWAAMLPVLCSPAQRCVLPCGLIDQCRLVVRLSEVCLLEAGGARSLGVDVLMMRLSLICLATNAYRVRQVIN